MSSRLTYKSLYQQVRDEIDKSKIYNTSSGYKQQLSRTSVTPVSVSGAGEVDISQIISSLQDYLTNSIPPYIKEGLTVSATTPESADVIISAGSGAAAGYFYELEADTQITIPFDATTEIFYLNLYQDRILVEKNKDDNKLTIAKIVVPQPGTTSRVIDTKDSSPDAYIVNFKTYNLYGDANGNFEEDTVELLRSNIGPILADNLIGNIRLNEDLKIINTQGTMELDSSEMRILDTDGNLLAKFNKNGTFFYNTSGVELAKFSSTEARVGNIIIDTDSIQSDNYIADLSGFIIRDDGYAEFENVKIRGAFHTAVFIRDTISAIGGNLLVAESDVLSQDMTSLDSSTLTTEGNVTFAVGDILRIKDQDNDEWFEVTNISNAPTYTVTRDKDSFYTSNNNPAWTAGATVVNYGQSGEGHIFITSSLNNSPYLSVITQAGSPWDTLTERLRLGRLDGFLDYPEVGESGYSGPYYGIAIGELTKYLKYDPDGGLVIRGNFTMDSGFIGGAEGWQIIGNEIIGSSHSSIRGGQTAYATGAGFFLGYDIDNYKLSIGDASNYLRWDGDSLIIRGSLIMGEGSSIGSGIISADSFVDTVTGDLSIGAVYAKKSLENNIKWSEYQLRDILDSSDTTQDTPSGSGGFSFADGVIQLPNNINWDESGNYWDESGLTWDGTTILGTYVYTSGVKDIGANYNSLPIMTAVKEITSPNTVSVQVAYSEDNVTWSAFEDAYPATTNGVTTWFLSNIVKARYLQYKITFVISDNTTTTYLENIYFKTLALYKTVIFPDIVFSGNSDEDRILQDLDDYFSKEYTISIIPQGTSSLMRGQIVTKTSPPSSLTLRLVNESNVSVAGTADITLTGY